MSQSSSQPVAAAIQPNPAWWLPLLVGLLATVPFWSALDHEFVWDDQLNIVENPHIHQLDAASLKWMLTETYGGHYHPLTWFTLALNYHFSGPEPAAFIATNIVLHGLVAALLFCLIQHLLAGLFAHRDRTVHGWTLAAAVLFWALHPLRVESVVWATERRNLLAGFFLLLALLSYLKFAGGDRGKRRWFAICLLATSLSLLAKAWAITLPVILLLLDFYPLKRKLRVGLFLEKLPFFLLSIVFGMGALMAQSTEAMATLASHGIAERAAQLAYNLAFLPVKTIVPTGLSPLYLLQSDFGLGHPGVLFSIAAVTLITGAAIYLAYRCKCPGPLVGWLIAIIVLLPVAGIAQSGSQITADRYTYLAAMPFSLLLAGALHLLAQRYSLLLRLLLPMFLILLLSAVATFRQTTIWQDAHSLWSHAIAQDSTNYVAYYNRGIAAEAGKDPQSSYDNFTRALALNPNYAAAYNNRGRLLLNSNRPAAALTDFRQAVSLDPTLVQPHINIGVIYLEHFKDPAAAAVAYTKALSIQPDNYAALANLGVIHHRQGEPGIAIDYLTQALETNAGNGLVWLNLGLCYLELDQFAMAEEALQHAIRRAPGEPACWFTLGKLQLAQHRRNEAAASLQQALRLAAPTWPQTAQVQQLLQQATN